MRSDLPQPLPMPDPTLAKACRDADETARRDPFWTPEMREQRAAFYEAEARRHEGRAS